MSLLKLTWDEVVHIACAACNFIPNRHSKESVFFLMFGKGCMLNPKISYMSDDKSFFPLNVLRDSYALVIHNIKLSRERLQNQFPTYPIPEFCVGEKVIIRHHVGGVCHSQI